MAQQDQDTPNAQEWRQRSKQALRERKLKAGQAAVDKLPKGLEPVQRDAQGRVKWPQEAESQAARNLKARLGAKKDGPAYQTPAPKPPLSDGIKVAEPRPPNLDRSRLDPSAEIKGPRPYRPLQAQADEIIKRAPQQEYRPKRSFADGGRRVAEAAMKAPKIVSSKLPGSLMMGVGVAEAARRLKGAAADKTGGEGSYDANVKSGAAKATGIGAAPSFGDRVAAGMGIVKPGETLKARFKAADNPTKEQAMVKPLVKRIPPSLMSK